MIITSATSQKLTKKKISVPSQENPKIGLRVLKARLLSIISSSITAPKLIVVLLFQLSHFLSTSLHELVNLELHPTSLFFWLNVVSWLKIKTPKMAKSTCYFGFLFTTYLHLKGGGGGGDIAKFLYWVLVCSQKMWKNLQLFNFHILFMTKFG
jgi:hypothetical protein